MRGETHTYSLAFTHTISRLAGGLTYYHDCATLKFIETGHILVKNSTKCISALPINLPPYCPPATK